MPVQPKGTVEGRFAPAEELPGGWYLHGATDSGMILPNTVPQALDVPRFPPQSRTSMDSLVSGFSANNSIYMPEQVEFIMSEEDRRKYFYAQQAQQAPTGAYMNVENLDRGRVFEMTDEMNRKGTWSGDIDDLSSEEEMPLRSRIPSQGLQSYNEVEGFVPGSSPKFAPTKPSRLSSYSTADSEDYERQNYESSTAEILRLMTVRQTEQTSNPSGRVPLIRLSGDDQVEPIETRQSRRSHSPFASD